MRIYNNKDSSKNTNGKPKRSCSYCGQTDHIITDCPNAVNDWAYFQRYEIPLKQANHWTLQCKSWNGVKIDHWYRSPQQWGKWFLECEKAIHKINNAKAKAKAKRKASKCGFCGSTHHNRRQCPVMEQFKQQLLEANRGWRQRFYDKLVADLGLSVGAVVNVKISGGWNEPDEDNIGIIESINWDQLSMFCYSLNDAGWYANVRKEFRQNLEIYVNVGGETRLLRFRNGNDQWGHPLSELRDEFGTLADIFGYWRGGEATFISTIARSETPLDEEWVNQGHESAMDFLIKKYSFEKLKEWNVEKLLNSVELANEAKKLKLSA